MGGQAAGQRRLLHDLACDDIGERHLGGGDQPPAVRGLVAVFAEFRQLPGAEHRVVADEDGGIDLGQAVLKCMNIQHELRQRAVDTGDGAAEQDEAGAGEFCRRFEIHARSDARDVEMFDGREVEFARGAPAVDLDIAGLVFAVGNVICGQVGQGGEGGLKGGVLRLCLFLQPGDFVFLFSD